MNNNETTKNQLEHKENGEVHNYDSLKQIQTSKDVLPTSEELEKKVLEANEQIKKAIESNPNLMKNDFYLPNDNLNSKTTKIQIYCKGDDDFIPKYQTLGASGLDVLAFIDKDTPITLQPLERALIPTGIYVNLPDGYEFQLRPRSGLALKKGLTLVNCVGTIDDDYVGEIGAIIINLSNKPQTIERGDRIAQLVLAKVEKVVWDKVTSTDGFNSKDRVGGYGSTNK